MALATGERLGQFEILGPLGKGGMGEVYQARDMKLDRVVAVKVLPELVARDRDLLVRFEREAKTLAGLNHANIAHLYGVHEARGVMAIIMEYVPGPTLADQIRAGPIPIAEAIGIARQIATALEAAHENGVIHRDLKPANVKVTPDGTVKLLDFGLAKSKSEVVPVSDLANSPTVTLRETEAGVILGTAGYMAPEQIRGTPIDKRVDIWAFGVVLFEMLSGEKLFTGPTASDILAATLRAEIDWTLLPRETPGAIRRLMERCLQRDRKLRLRDIGDAFLADDGAVAASAVGTAQPVWPWMVLAAGLAIALAMVVWRGKAEEGPVRRLRVSLGEDVNLAAFGGNAFALSPDGSRLVYVSLGKDGIRRLFTRRLDQMETRPLTGTEGARSPFFHPDGTWIGYFEDHKLKKISVEGGASVQLAEGDPKTTTTSGSWGPDGAIVAAFGGALVKVPESGGPAQPLTALKDGEVRHQWPQFLPGGKTLVFTSNKTATPNSGVIEAVSMATGERKVLHKDGGFGRYVATGKKSGHLTWAFQETLYAAPMDPDRLELTGAAVPVIERVMVEENQVGHANAEIAGDGTLVYLEKRSRPLTTLQWMDPSGLLRPILAKPGDYSYPVPSPDGRFLAYLQRVGNNTDLWVNDLERDVPRRITFTAENEYVFAWTPDQRWIIYSTGNTLKMVRAEGGSDPITVFEAPNSVFLHAISADGKHLAFCQNMSGTGNDLWTARLEGTSDEPKVVGAAPFSATRFVEIFAGFSPDGKWLAYSSDESGTPEIYARPYPSGPGKVQISNHGGAYPIWAPNGRELLYRDPELQLQTVDYKSVGGQLVVTKPRLWMASKVPASYNLRNLYIAPDGKKLAVAVPQEKDSLRGISEVVWVQNFARQLRGAAGK